MVSLQVSLDNNTHVFRIKGKKIFYIISLIKTFKHTTTNDEVSCSVDVFIAARKFFELWYRLSELSSPGGLSSVSAMACVDPPPEERSGEEEKIYYPRVSSLRERALNSKNSTQKLLEKREERLSGMKDIVS